MTGKSSCETCQHETKRTRPVNSISSSPDFKTMKTKMELTLLTGALLALLLSTSAQSLPNGTTRFPAPNGVRPVGVQPTGVTPVGVRPGGVALGSQPPTANNTPVILPPPPVVQAPAIAPPPAISAPAANDLPATMTATAPVINVTNVVRGGNNQFPFNSPAPVLGATNAPIPITTTNQLK